MRAEKRPSSISYQDTTSETNNANFSCRELGAEHVLYIHCYGGHGRTGTVVANTMMAMEGVDFPTAMAKLQWCHRGRGCRGHCALNAVRKTALLFGFSWLHV